LEENTYQILIPYDIYIDVTTGFSFLQLMLHTMLCPHYSVLDFVQQISMRE